METKKRTYEDKPQEKKDSAVEDLEFAFQMPSYTPVVEMGSIALSHSAPEALGSTAYEQALGRFSPTLETTPDVSAGTSTRSAIGGMRTYRGAPPDSEIPTDFDKTFGNDDEKS